MPGGIPINFYFKSMVCCFLAAAAGSEAVHLWYSPDLSIPEVPPKKGELHTNLYTRNILFKNSDKQEK